MTTVHFQIGRPSRDGQEPSRGELWLITTRRIAVGKTVILPAPCVIPLDRGEATAQLTPTDPRWCWKIVEHTPGGGTRHVSVPDSDQLIEYADLDDIDPRTLKTKDYGEDSWQSWFDQHASQLKGPAGPKGDRGEKGEHGNRITIGTGAPGEPSADGIDGDVYIDAATGDLYQIQNQ